MPREWFLIPLPVIEEAIGMLKLGIIANHSYDPERAIQHHLLDPLALDVIVGKFADGDVIKAEMQGAAVFFSGRADPARSAHFQNQMRRSPERGNEVPENNPATLRFRHPSVMTAAAF